jgi:hypothetical protein
MEKSLYLDWNIFNKLEDLDNLIGYEAEIFRKIKKSIDDSEFSVPYSNAHLNDLLRGYLKDPRYTPAHLKFIEHLTNNLCIVQYWKQKYATMHYRDVNDFFQTILDEVGFLPDSFSELMRSTVGDILENEEDVELISLVNTQRTLIELQLEKLAKLQVPKEFMNIYKVDPIFERIYPRTKVDKTFLALCEDGYKFSTNINSDYSLYKGLKKYINAAVHKLKNDKALLTIGDIGPDGPGYLTYEEIYDKSIPDFKPSENLDYDKIINLFTKLDMSGVNSDEKFQNMFDDSLHTFYAAHCDYFITIDKKCHAKATEVYKRLEISTQVMFPEEFIQHIQ